MLKLKKQTLGNVTQSRTALDLFAATLLVGGTATEASAKSTGTTITTTIITPAMPPGAASVLARCQCLDRTIVGAGRSFSGMASYLRQRSPAARPPPASASTRTP